MGSRNFCDMTPAERTAALAECHYRKERNKALLSSIYGKNYDQNEGGTPYLYYGSEWRYAPYLMEAADYWFAGHRSYWVRCGGAEMRCRMEKFPFFIVEEYLNNDEYGRRVIGEVIRPENTNEFKPMGKNDV